MKKYKIITVEAVMLMALCLLRAISMGHNVDFFPINGTFQNYNPVRRLLSGQIPYKDFFDYLGMGHLYLGSFFTEILGGKFRDSLIAFSFLTFLSFSLMSLMIGKAILKEWKIAWAVTIIMLIWTYIFPTIFYVLDIDDKINYFFNLIYMEWFSSFTKAVIRLIGILLSCFILGFCVEKKDTNKRRILFFVLLVFVFGLTNEVRSALSAVITPGNSARFIRGMILPIVAIIFNFFDFCYERNKQYFERIKMPSFMPQLIVGGVAGLSFIWSNDYGISCFVCIILMSSWISLSRKRNFVHAIYDMFLISISSIVSLCLFVEIFTRGNILNWFNITFSSGNYQGWYYNSSKSFYLYDIDYSYFTLIQAVLAVIYLIKLYKMKGTKVAVLRYGTVAFCNMVCFCAVNEYKLLSGGSSREVAITVLFMTMVFEVLNLIREGYRYPQYEKKIMSIPLVICTVFVVGLSAREIHYFEKGQDGVYNSILGGNMTKLHEDIKATDRFLQGEKFFSTYASAQEVMSNIYQPSGFDYIIHVLGDKQRKQYLTDFLNGDFRYTATIRKDYTTWEYWIERANWYFYRELYQNWHPVYANTYELYWERNDSKYVNSLSDNYEVEIEWEDESTVKLSIHTDSKINGIADVYIDYSVEKKNLLTSKLVFNRMLQIENTGYVRADDSWYESNFLRDASTEYIPMTIHNGYGELKLTALPSKDCLLKLNEVGCKTIIFELDKTFFSRIDV